MSYYPDVIPGTPVRFSAGRETAINRLLNQADSFKTGVIHAKSQNVVRIKVWNSTQTAFAAGQAVQINVSGSLCGDAFPAVNFASVDVPWGVCATGIAPNAIGDLILSGPASVTISGSTGSYAKPVSGGTFARGTEGNKILHISGTTAIVLLGDYKMPSSSGGSTASFGPPDYSNPLISGMEVNREYPAYSFPVWVIGEIGFSSASQTSTIVGGLKIGQYNGIPLFEYSNTEPPTYTFMTQIFAVIPPNNTFEISSLYIGNPTDLQITVAVFPCL